MSAPKVGDRVRVTFEAIVTDVLATVNRVQIETEERGLWIPQSSFVEVIAAPLPTTPGSVIEQDGCQLILGTTNNWVCPDHSGITSGDDLDGYEVIRDAGAES